MATSPENVTQIRFYTVKDIMFICGVGRSKAYELIVEANKRLEAKGKITIQGKVNAKFFDSLIED